MAPISPPQPVGYPRAFSSIPHFAPKAFGVEFPRSRYAGLRGFTRLYASGLWFSTRVNPHNHSRKPAYSKSHPRKPAYFAKRSRMRDGPPTTSGGVPANGNYKPPNRFFAPFLHGEKNLSGTKRYQPVQGGTPGNSPLQHLISTDFLKIPSGTPTGRPCFRFRLKTVARAGSTLKLKLPHARSLRPRA